MVAYSKSQLDAVSAILIGCYSPESDKTSGTGTIDIDNIRVVYSDSCGHAIVGDINSDCVVNLGDLPALAASWLTEILY
jgi:hypothetical protein